MIIFQNTYDICKKKIDKHMSVYPKDNVYQYSACSDGNYKINTTPSLLKNKFAWTASFITGLAPLIYNTEKDERYIKWAEQYSMFYADKIFNHPLNTMHDLGFLYSAYSVAMYNHTGSKLHRDTALKAADELLKRFDINGRYIDAWNDMDNDQRTGRAIVDCMLNIQLLFWAWKANGTHHLS